jgi:hypothetical protein
VIEAIEMAGLTEKEFAGVYTFTEDDGSDWLHLRRDEFVSLNTWQIQKLKPRVTQLEEKIILLEQHIAKLEKN